MKTNFYKSNTNNLILAGETIEKLYIYNDGDVFAEIENLQEHEIKNDCISSVYDGVIEKIWIDGDIKRANKLNLNRKDNFIIKNPDKIYCFDKPYVLYLHLSEVVFDLVGDVLATKFEHEENYLETYRITFKKISIRRNKLERIPCDNYILQEGEQFSDCYGSDKKHPCVSYYDASNHSLFAIKHPERANEKGIIKKWREDEISESKPILITKRCYTKCIKDDYRKNLEKISDDLKAININLSYYDLDKLSKAGYTISKEA